MIGNKVRFGILALAAVLFASCAAGTLVDSPTGSISFAFPKSVLSRGVDEEYQVAIYYGLDQYDAAPSISDNEMTFSGIPTGDVRIIVAKGIKEDGFFYTDKYGQLFITIVAGDNGPYDLDLENSEFKWEDVLKGEDVNGLAELDDVLYVSTADTLKKVTYIAGALTADAGPEVPPEMAVNSVSVGKVYEDGVVKPQVWVNGTWTAAAAGGGIMPWVGSGLDPDFASGFGNPLNREGEIAADFEVTYSGAFEVPGEKGLALIFQRDGGMGGVYLTESDFSAPRDEWDDWPWIVDEINFAELLSDVVEEGTEFIRDIKVSPEFSAAYIVTSILTMKISEDFISGDIVFDSADAILNSNAVAFAPYLGSSVVCMELSGSGDGETIYVGTENGLYSGLASSESGEFFEGSPTLVSGTGGYFISLISVSPPDGDFVAFTARRGTNPDLLIIVDTESDAIVDFRGLQGLPGTRLSNLVWLDGNILAVSGDHGLTVMDASQLF
ncbi:MAG: hypothetical protein JW852_05670 [Spirochaetales bacterium]|nr:hypothetical protein [Spirochaetales bacterium]